LLQSATIKKRQIKPQSNGVCFKALISYSHRNSTNRSKTRFKHNIKKETKTLRNPFVIIGKSMIHFGFFPLHNE